MESSTTIVTKALMLFAVLAAVPLWVMSGLTVDDLARPFRGDVSASPAPRTEVDLGDETTEFPFDRKIERNARLRDQCDPPQIEIAVPNDAPNDGATHQGSLDAEQPFWNDSPPIGPPPAFAGPDSLAGPENLKSPTAPPRDEMEPAAPASDDIAALMGRLDMLGAVNMLSTRMSRGQAYRFRCEFPIPANANMRRYFEATDTSEQRAVQRVLAEVKRWRETQSQF